MEPTGNQITHPTILTGGTRVYHVLLGSSASEERKTGAHQDFIAHLVHQIQSAVLQATTVLLVRRTLSSAVRDITTLRILVLTVQIVSHVRLDITVSFQV